MLEINTSFDDRDAHELLTAWIDRCNGSMESAVKTAGRVAARSFGESTWPKHQEQGTDAVDTQVRRVYGRLWQAYEAIEARSTEATAKAFWAFTHTKRRDWARAQGILMRYGGSMAVPLAPFDKGAAHMERKRRNKRGRIPPGRVSMVIQSDTQGAKGTTQLDRYIENKQKLVGLTQSAWYNCLRLLGGRNRRSKSPDNTGDNTETTTPFPDWVKRHKSKGYGKVTVEDEPSRYGVVLHNDIRWASNALNRSTERYIMEKSRRHMIKFLEVSLNKQAQQRRRRA